MTRPAHPTAPSDAALLERLRAVAGEDHVLTAGGETRRYLLDFGWTPEVLNNNLDLLQVDVSTIDALISSAYPLDAAQLNNLVSQLETHFGCKLQPRVEVDAALIGGVRVAVGDEVLDASVRGKLDAMATALKN